MSLYLVSGLISEHIQERTQGIILSTAAKALNIFNSTKSRCSAPSSSSPRLYTETYMHLKEVPQTPSPVLSTLHTLHTMLLRRFVATALASTGLVAAAPDTFHLSLGEVLERCSMSNLLALQPEATASGIHLPRSFKNHPARQILPNPVGYIFHGGSVVYEGI